MTKKEVLKTAKPILFNTEMVRAILDGRKTVTRRVIKPQPRKDLTYPLGWSYTTHKRGAFGWGEHETGGTIDMAKPRYHKDDILYVRETWANVSDWVDVDPDTGLFDGYIYKAEWKNDESPKWRPSIHMPKSAARIFLRVTKVRVERLQDITTDECRNEGCCSSDCLQTGKHSEDCKCDTRFINTWNSTIKKQDLDRYGWEANPWVWVYEFERIGI